MAKPTNVRFDGEELHEVREGVRCRRGELESIRKKLETAGIDTFAVDSRVEVLDRVKVAIGDEPEDMFTEKKEKVDPTTGEVLDDE